MATEPPNSPAHKEEFVPVSDRMRELRGQELTDTQVAQIEKFMSTVESGRERQAFQKAFAIARALEDEISKFGTATGKLSQRLTSHIRRLGAQLTPAKKAKAIEERRPLVRKMLEYVREHGAPKNFRDLYRWLGQDALRRKNKWGKRYWICETTVRDVWRTIFGPKANDK